jgi:hypothetical protein
LRTGLSIFSWPVDALLADIIFYLKTKQKYLKHWVQPFSDGQYIGIEICSPLSTHARTPSLPSKEINSFFQSGVQNMTKVSVPHEV